MVWNTPRVPATEVLLNNSTVADKIREAEVQKVPVMLVIGDQEVADGTVTPRRRRDAERSAEAVPVDVFQAELRSEIEERRH